MFNFLKKNCNKVEETVEAPIKLDIYAEFKLDLPELQVACVEATGDTSLNKLLKEFEAKVKVPAFFLAPPHIAFKRFYFEDSAGYYYPNVDEIIRSNVTPILVKVYDELVKHVQRSKLSSEAAQLLMSSVRYDYESMHNAFQAHRFYVAFEEGVEIGGYCASEILEKAEKYYEGVENAALLDLRRVVAKIDE